MSKALCLRVEVPICAFRPYTSREYQDTYPVPTPASLYGMLLSLVGVVREDKSMHRGAELAMALPSLPGRSRVFRKLRRGDLHELRPDYQDLLIDVTLWAWLRRGTDSGSPPLVERVEAALRNPRSVTRSGGLSLGESSYLVNEVVLEKAPPVEALLLVPDAGGFYSLPVWVDHLDATGSRSRRFSLEKLALPSALDQCWFGIGQP